MSSDDKSGPAVRQGSPREQAVALQYSENDAIPRIISSGAGEVARTIIRLARESGVPVRRDAELVRLLDGLPGGAAIPPETFRLVAEVLAFLYKADAAFREKHPHLKPVLGDPIEELPRLGSDGEPTGFSEGLSYKLFE